MSKIYLPLFQNTVNESCLWLQKYWRCGWAHCEDLSFLLINLACTRKYSFLVIWKPKQYNSLHWQHYYLKSRFLCWFGHIKTNLNRFSKVHTSLNLESNMMFSSKPELWTELWSSSELSSEPNYGTRFSSWRVSRNWLQEILW